MLDAMRKQASSWVVRVLLVLLIVSFAVWGIGDIFLGTRSGAAIAEVGDLEVSAVEVNREFDDQINRFRQQFNASLDRGQAIAFGLLNQAVQTRIARRLVDMHGLELGLGVADSTVRTAITEDPLFRSQSGFERERLDLMLRGQGMSEAQFIEEVRDDLRRAMLVDAVSGLVEVPRAQAEAMFAFRNEQRRATALRLVAGSIAIDDPDDAVLESWLADNRARFEAPEYRSGLIVVIEPQDLVDEIEIPEAEIAEAYNARLARYSTPERRKVGQLLASDRAVIDEALKRIEGGATLAETADALADRGLGYSSIGPLAQGDLPEALGTPIFALADTDSLSEPVESAFGWHLFRLIESEPETVTPLAEVRDALVAELALDRARLQMPDLANALDDEIAAGTSLEQAAEQLGFDALALDGVDRSGMDRDGNPVGEERLSGDVLAKFFEGGAGEISLLEQTGDGYLMYRVDTIDPPRDRTLDEVRQRVLDAWKVERRQERAMADAAAILGRLASDGATLEELAGELGDEAVLTTSEPLRRADNPAMAGLSPDALAMLFRLDAGEVAGEAIEVPGGAIIIRNDEIIAADPPEDLDELRGEIADQQRNDLLVQYEQALRHRFPVQIDQAALQALAAALSPEQ